MTDSQLLPNCGPVASTLVVSLSKGEVTDSQPYKIEGVDRLKSIKGRGD